MSPPRRKRQQSLAPIPIKVCSGCKEAKPLTEYKPRADQPGKHKSACKSCERLSPSHLRWLGSAKKKAWDTAYRRSRACPIVTEHRALYRALPDTPMARWLKRIRLTKKKKHGKLTGHWVVKWHAVTACPVTGLPFDLSGETVNGSPHPLSPSADRIDSTLGYTDANTRVVSYFANVAKNAWTEEQFRLLVMAAASNMRH